jgi:4-diphosphocytidyl-2-C-methyl-D-erythritol kinase
MAEALAAALPYAMPLRELARAKVNLTLRVLGRRPDGYHDIASLVAFAAIGDGIAFTPGPDRQVKACGPFAAAIVGPNLLDRVLELLHGQDPQLQLGAVALDKILPVAAGLGGGSADAAALLRAVRRANPKRGATIDWQGLAVRLGADVPVCLAGELAMMGGIGDRLEAVGPSRVLPPLPCVLVNPRVALPTSRVFAAFDDTPLSPGTGAQAAQAPALLDVDRLLAHMRAHGNDLEPAATSLLPLIAEIKSVLTAQTSCRVAAMSGSGPTCFGIFREPGAAEAAAQEIARKYPKWWIQATHLG